MVSTNVSQTAHDKIAAIGKKARAASLIMAKASSCLLYTSDAADEL